jgi:hypothetical protein
VGESTAREAASLDPNISDSKRGRLFHAKVIEVHAAGALLVEPIERNISYRHLQAPEITEHWTRRSSTPRAAREPKAQATLEPLLAL